MPVKPLGRLLCEWRQRRRLSQAELARDAGISAGYLSNLENGRAQPGHGVVLRLADCLGVPLRERNPLLTAAGLPPSISERPLDDPMLGPVRSAIDAILLAHDPHPAFAIDRHWTLVAANRGLRHLITGSDPVLLRDPVNVVRLTLHPAGLAPRIVNLQRWRAHLINRLERQIAAAGDPTLSDLLEEIRDYPAPRAQSGPDGPGSEDTVAVLLRLATIDGTLSFFTTATVFGNVLDVTVAELAIIALIPADSRTADLLRRGAPLAAGG